MHHAKTNQRGVALVITLAMIVLVTLVVVAFFSRATADRSIEATRSERIRVEELTRSASDYVVGRLLNEMVSQSEVSETDGWLALIPNTPADRVPSRILSAAVDGDDPAFHNLIRQSVPAADSNASAHSSALPSGNGRLLRANRWNAPQLLGDNGFEQDDQLPCWIYFDHEGIEGSQPDNETVGRFAYNIYDVGGLIDIGVAGSITIPASRQPPTEQVSRKGSLAYADLTRIGFAQDEINDLVDWRNAATAASGSLYANYVSTVSKARGSLFAAPGDRQFLTRQDLIRYFQREGLDTALVRHLSTFSREKNAPNWMPSKNADEFGGQNSVTGLAPAANRSYAYHDDRNLAGAFNRSVLNARVTTPFVRRDGRQATVGEPLVDRRFDLHRLSWIRHNGLRPTGVTEADIQREFGLARNADASWTYAQEEASRILTLAEVSAAGREPDFFELLKAVILSGSLGLHSGDPGQANTEFFGGEFWRRSNISWVTPLVRQDGDGNLVHRDEKYQIIQIGANIIDQYDEDNFPTEIELNGERFYGVENLPFITALAHTALRPPVGGAIAPNEYQAYVHQWLVPAFWNPHQHAALAPAGGPQSFRMLVKQGDVQPYVFTLRADPNIPSRSGPSFIGGEVFTETDPSWMQFDISDYSGRFAEPATLSIEASSVSDPRNHITQFEFQRVGIYLGWSFSPDHPTKVPESAPLFPLLPDPGTNNNKSLLLKANVLPRVEMQYLDSSTSQWRTFQDLRGVAMYRSGRGEPYMAAGDPAWLTFTSTGSPATLGPLTDGRDSWVHAFLDPRTARLNFPSRMGRRLTDQYDHTGTNRIDTSPPQGPHFVKVPATSSWPVAWSFWPNNTDTATSYYTDRDFVRRPGDAFGWAGADPTRPGSQKRRPLILNRPFRSVAEIGYTFRDVPWRTLDLSTPDSPDAGLLDVFYLGGAAGSQPTQADPRVVAGKVNLNSAPPEVVKALISGSARDFLLTDASQVQGRITTEADLDAILAKWLENAANHGPISNLSELTLLLNSTGEPPGSAFPPLKTMREAVVRALADSGQVRTWNLLIDLTAQSGQYTGDRFTVRAEKSIWMHLALDRYTGEIVDIQIENFSQ